MSEDKHIVDNLCNGLFPNIYGNREIKLGIILQLFGGVGKKLPGTSLRGDINICLIGDPSCGKSQFLKFVDICIGYIKYSIIIGQLKNSRSV